MITILFAAAGAYGVHLMYSAWAFGWVGVGVGKPRARTSVRRNRRSISDWLVQAGVGDTSAREFWAASVGAGIAGAAIAWVIFGGIIVAAAAGLTSSLLPVAAFRSRRTNRIATAQGAWPHLIEEIRVLTGAAGRSIPQALFEVGVRGPEAFRAAFAEAQREWLLSTDFEATIDLLQRRLADPAADIAFETLLVAHRLGGADLDRRLSELAEDRRLEQVGRLDAMAKQAGVRFARRFVILVPLGMAVAGMSLGTGRAAYQTATGQALVLAGLVMTAACWWWSGHMLRLPDERRVFER